MMVMTGLLSDETKESLYVGGLFQVIGEITEDKRIRARILRNIDVGTIIANNTELLGFGP